MCLLDAVFSLDSPSSPSRSVFDRYYEWYIEPIYTHITWFPLEICNPTFLERYSRFLSDAVDRDDVPFYRAVACEPPLQGVLALLLLSDG